MDVISQYLEAVTFIITIMGLPAAIFIYLKEQKSQRLEREYGTFDALDQKYIEIQQLCLDHSELDVFDSPYANPKNFLKKKRSKRRLFFSLEFQYLNGLS